MSTHPDHPQQQAPAPVPASRRPGWPEIAVGILVWTAGVAAVKLFRPLGLDADPVAYGLLLAAWSGVAGLTAFGAAAVIRLRSLSAFGVRRTTWRWLLVGVAAGVAALVVKMLVGIGAALLLGNGDTSGASVQGPYYDAAGGGVLPLILTIAFLSVLTPIGEEFIFRGVLTNALLRYGPVIGVLSSSIVFALFHGINAVLPAAVIVGIIAAELMRRSGSIWPSVVVHIVNNLGLPVSVLVTGLNAAG